MQNRFINTHQKVNSSKKVFWVDSDHSLVEHYRRALTTRGYEVDVAPSGTFAIEKLETYRPDIIFLDYMLPNMMGCKVLEAIRGRAKLKNVPVIIITETLFNMDECFLLGATGYLNKANLNTRAVLECLNIYPNGQ